VSKLGWDSLGTRFQCESCGERHELPIEAVYIGPDAAQRLAAFATQHLGRSCAVISDANTRAAGGEPLLRALRDAHITVREKTYGPESLEAGKEEADAVASAGVDADFFVGLGSGTVCDLAKYAGHMTEKPVLLFPTAASMNGYTSAIAALRVDGLKRTLPCRPALGVFADPAISAKAPARMVAAGVADYLSKCSSSADWQASHILRNEYYCERPREFFEGTTQQLLEAAPKAGAREETAVATVLEALMLSGLSMVVAGSSAPASGGEHLLSHFIDMKHALYGTGHDLHGAQVGVGTIYCLGLWEKILAFEMDGVDREALIARQPSMEQVTAWTEEDWGPELGRRVLEQWKRKAPSPEQLTRELETFRVRVPELREKLQQDLLPAATVAEAVRAAGGPTLPEELEAATAEYYRAQHHARFLRDRFTVLDLAAELGIA
jgi:glycerol-1-phosphate dehydrogenase [NAD(P)+]